MLFFVKVRIDINKLAELGEKLQSGELDKSSLKSTYCLQDDPAVGLNIWEAKDKKDFEIKFEPHREYYAEVLEIAPVILPAESQKLLMAQITI
jgi:hypothetical protein